MAKQPQPARAKGKAKRKGSSTFLWGLLGLVILTAGVVSALYYMNRERIETDTRLRVIKDFVTKVDKTIAQGKSTLQTTYEKGKSAANVAGEKLSSMKPEGMRLPGLGGRTYTVKGGENLWRIAKEGGLVDNPWQWRTILIQNRAKIEWAFINEDEQDWKVMIARGQVLSVSKDGQPRVEVTGERKYAFQLASMPERGRKRAVFLVRTLMRDGYYAYVHEGKKDGKTLYRIRSGFYDSEARAKAVGAAVRERYTKQGYFPEELWVLQPTAAEQRGEGMVFGAQLANPWVLELRDRETHGDAVADLHRVGQAGDFAYIWQARNPITKRFVYHVRIGFFASEDAAKKVAAGKKGDAWDGAKPVKLEKFEETLPGQPMMLGEMRS
jgi:SPOR domain